MKYFIFITTLIITLSIIVYLNINSASNVLKNTKWTLTGWSISSKDPTLAKITISFDDKVNGNGGVNFYSGKYIIKNNNKITIKDVSSTEIAAADTRINENEATYFLLLQEVRYYSLDDNTLKLLDENKNELLIFNKK